MVSRFVVSVIILAIIGSTATYFVVSDLLSAPGAEIVCPEDGSIYVLTPIGTRSENFNWRCLECGHQWTESYPEGVYQAWRNKFLEPAFVRDFTLLYLKITFQLDIPDPLALDWTGGRETRENILGYEQYVYQANSIILSVGYPVVLPENTIYEIKVEVDGRTVWEGKLHRREFSKSGPTNGNEYDTLYDFYGAVGIFEKGIHVIATSGNPLDSKDEYELWNEYWQWLKSKETTRASTEDFISIIIARGDHPTGGYTIQVESFSWLESYPVKFRFHVNFTDPGEGVFVTEAFTNPLVLFPVSKLDPGEYVVEVHIVQYIMTFDEEGKPVYTQLQTLREEVWTETFVIE